MAFGFGSLPSADDAALSPDMAAFLQARLAGMPTAQPAAPAQADASAAPTIPPEVDAALAQRGLPSMSSVLNGVLNGASGDGQAVTDFGGKIGGLLGGMVSRSGDLIGKMRDGTISPTEFLGAAAGRARDMAVSGAMAGPNFTRDFLDGKIDPGSEAAAGGALNAAASVAGMSSVVPAPAGALRVFGGRNAATADLGALSRAEQMAGLGGDKRSIWDRTGWFQGPDQKWRFEIPDDAAKIGAATEKQLADTGESSGLAAGTLWHKPLYEAYPDLRRMQVETKSTPIVNGQGVAGGSYVPNGPGLVTAKAPGPDGLQSVLLHEFQHAVQNAEGFAPGTEFVNAISRTDPGVKAAVRAKNDALMSGDPNAIAQATQAHKQALYDIYAAHAGEVEARNVQTRRNFTPEQRRAIPPWETQDVPDARQILSLPFSPVVRKVAP